MLIMTVMEQRDTSARVLQLGDLPNANSSSLSNLKARLHAKLGKLSPRWSSVNKTTMKVQKYYERCDFFQLGLIYCGVAASPGDSCK